MKIVDKRESQEVMTFGQVCENVPFFFVKDNPSDLYIKVPTVYEDDDDCADALDCYNLTKGEFSSPSYDEEIVVANATIVIE